MALTPKEIIRMNIDDPVQLGMTTSMSIGELAIYQLNHRNVAEVIVKDQDGNTVSAENYTLYAGTGQLRGTLPEGEVIFEYIHSGFSDDELDYFLGELDDSINKVTLACVDVLLASAAKRFDYKAGLKDIKASQVFDHLKQLRTQFAEKVEAEDNENGIGNVAIVVDRVHPFYTVDITKDPVDVTRSDS